MITARAEPAPLATKLRQHPHKMQLPSQMSSCTQVPAPFNPVHCLDLGLEHGSNPAEICPVHGVFMGTLLQWSSKVDMPFEIAADVHGVPSTPQLGVLQTALTKAPARLPPARWHHPIALPAK